VHGDIEGQVDSTNLEQKARFEQQRYEKLAQVRQFGVEPYGGKYEGTEAAEDVKSTFIDGDPSQQARCAGRIVLLRDLGKLIFITLRDRSGTIQIGLSKKLLAREWELVKLLDLGDIIGAAGQLGRTKTGEITIWAESLAFLSKCLRQPPEKFHGLSDVDLRYRHRYVDLWANPEVMERFKKRSAVIATVREFLQGRGFLEVETPMMQTVIGGAAAKVFEINRNFRNEGLSRQHNPEFTMLELYQAYADYGVMMDLTEELMSLCVEKHCQGKQVRFGEQTIDYSRPWRRVCYGELLKEHSGCDIEDIGAVREKARELGLDEVDMDDAVVVNEVFEATVEDHLVAPTFVMDYPAELCPLARRKKDNPKYAERFELYMGQMELANAYTELNDPGVQEENFRKQLRGQERSIATMDTDFITALKYGMPPAGGLGIGIDRLVMVLTGAVSIRDVVLFPLLKPAGE
jgi:lysyl-tRNA synthetase class 2